MFLSESIAIFVQQILLALMWQWEVSTPFALNLLTTLEYGGTVYFQSSLFL